MTLKFFTLSLGLFQGKMRKIRNNEESFSYPLTSCLFVEGVHQGEKEHKYK